MTDRARHAAGANMEYKNYEEWKAEGEKVQAELIRVDEQRRQAKIDGDDNAYVRLEDEYNRLLIQSRDHMAKMPLRSETPPKNTPPDKKAPFGFMSAFGCHLNRSMQHKR